MSETHVLYRMFDADGNLLYVGITGNPWARFRTHSKLQPWWPQVATIRVEHLPSRTELVSAERAAILAEGPRFNTSHQPRPVARPTAASTGTTSRGIALKPYGLEYVRRIAGVNTDGELAAAMGISAGQLSRVRTGAGEIGTRFLAGAANIVGMQAAFVEVFDIVEADRSAK